MLLVFVAGAVLGGRYMAAYQEPAPEDQEFAPAVTSACGRGFVNPTAAIPALQAFLHRQTPSFDCARLPAELSPAPLDLPQRLYRYLMDAVALQWRWSGVSWRSLAPLFGVLFGLTLCVLYGLFRIAGGPLAGVIGVVALGVSAHHLAYLPQLRDYAKAPFILCLILIAAHLAMPPFNRTRSLALSALFGLVLGVGLGFRNDLLINVPPFLGVVLLLTPVRWRDELQLKGACIGVAAAVFVAAAWPILMAYGVGSNTGHVAVLGLTSAFDEPLGVTRPIYDLGSHYLDGYAAVVIATHDYLKTGRFVEYLSPSYDAAALRLIGDVVRHWPGDIVTRGLSSVLEVLVFPFTVGQWTHAVPPGVSSAWAQHVYDWQGSVLRHFAGLGPVCAALAILVVGSRSVRAGLGLLLAVLYYCGYPAVQFDIRHFFHLEFVAWWALIFVVALAGRSAWQLVSERRWPRIPAAALKNALVTAAAAALVVLLPTAVLRAYQQRHVTSLFERYLDLHRTPLAIRRSITPAGTFVAVDGVWNDRRPGQPVSVGYLVAAFGAEGCSAADVPLTVKYDAKASDNDYSYLSRVAITPDGETLKFVPVYATEASRFAGFVMPSGYERCLKSVARIDDPGQVPVVLDLTLAPRWRTSTLYQRLSHWESDADAGTTTLRVVPGDLVEALDSRVIAAPQADRIAPGIAVNSTTHSWFTPEPLRVPESHRLWLQFPAQPLDGGSVLRVRGVLRRGGLRIGTTQNDRVIDSRAVTSPGAFTVLVGVPSAGAYGVRITDESAPEWRREPASLLRAGAAALAPSLLADEFELHDVAWIK
ncbi:MAG TPA: hypothetical protein VG871_18670 [Vicinamibacterales bacterium]|nr:hypothetical protein [Vicinamibacterales bacterium]